MAAAESNVKLTYGRLLESANSNNPTMRRQAFEAYQAWLKAAPNIAPADRLTATQRQVLDQIFKQKGLK